jgi:hypothetical protein
MLKIYIENDLLDLFQDESIELNSSIANVNDISKNTTDYAKSFTVPASSINNRIFKHYYDANIDNAFDARIKQNGRIELDGMPFRTGKIQLEKVILKKGVPYSYSINFVGNLVSLKDKLGNDELSILDLSEFDHDYNSATVKGLLQNTGDVIYTLFVKKQLYYKTPDTQPNTDKLSNIAYNSSGGLDWNLLKPSLRLIKIIEAIESKYTISFSRDFFGSIEFQNLYLWINNNSNLIEKANNEIRINFTNTGTIAPPIGEINVLEDYVTIFNRGVKRAYVTITPSAGYENVVYSIERRINDGSAGFFTNLQGIRTADWRSDDGQKHSYYVSSNSEFKFTSKLELKSQTNPPQSASFPEQTLLSNFVIANNLPKIKIIDFLKGLFSMFKLVVISDDNENLYIDTINNYYARGKVWNISRYVKTDTLEVSRGNLLNEISFKFKEPTTILNKQFKTLTGQAYGDEETKLTDTGLPDGKPLEGTALTIELPFEQIVYERLPDTYIMYASIIDENLSPVNPAPHIFYNLSVNHPEYPIGYINDVGAKELLNTKINTAFHSVDAAEPQFNLTFGSEFNEWNNIASENTLYSNHYKDYVESIFNIKRRNFKYSAVLPLRILLQLQLNDILEIKGNYYRIDNFNLNLLTRDVQLNLINAFDLTIGGFNADVSSLTADYEAQTQSISVPNIGNSTVAIDEDSWLSSTIVGTNIFFDFSENLTGFTRFNNAIITNLETLQTIDIFITQFSKIITADNNIITFDNNLITFDNG